jgi:hypothetical protein
VHTYWGPKTDRILALAGLSRAEIDKERLRRKRTLCADKPRARNKTRVLQQALFRLGVGPETATVIELHLNVLAARIKHLDDPADLEAAAEQLREYDRLRAQAYRDTHRAAYNESQKLLMRRLRASKKVDDLPRKTGRPRKNSVSTTNPVSSSPM